MATVPDAVREARALEILPRFTSVYCRSRHGGGAGALCAECAEFLSYAAERRRRCPLDPKPSCKHCPVHCYRPGHREQVRRIMRFSGRHLILRGRLDLLWKYLF